MLSIHNKYILCGNNNVIGFVTDLFDTLLRVATFERGHSTVLLIYNTAQILPPPSKLTIIVTQWRTNEKCGFFCNLCLQYGCNDVTRMYHLHHLSFAYLFPDVADLMDLLPYISRSCAVHPTLQTLALIQSSTSYSQDLLALLCFFGLSLFLLVFISTVFCVFLCPK